MKNKNTLNELHESWLEPDDPNVVAKDYNGKDLFFGDEVFVTEDGYVLADELQEYFTKMYGLPTVLE